MSIRILVVDDSTPHLRIARRIFELYGCTVIVAGNAVEALAALQQGPVDVALLDWHMGSPLTGYALLLALRNDERYQELRIYMVTGETATQSAEKAIQAGADGYFQKPFRWDVLVNQLKKDGLVLEKIAPGGRPGPLVRSIKVEVATQDEPPVTDTDSGTGRVLPKP